MNLKKKKKKICKKQQFSIDCYGISLDSKVGKINFSRRENIELPNWGWID